jgi:hypothetical protein
MARLMIAFLFFTVFFSSSFAATDKTKSNSSLSPGASQYQKQMANSTDLNVDAIQTLLSLKGQYDEKSKLLKIGLPRDDLTVSVNGVKLTSAMGLNSWVVFKKINSFTVMKGELVLTDTQVDPVMGAALNNHIAVTALHNHFLWDSPKIMFMRVEAIGNEQDLAKEMSRVLVKMDETSKGNGEFPVATIDTSNTTLNPTEVNSIVRAKGYNKNGIYRVAVGGAKINAQVVFAGSDNAAVVDGGFVVRESDLQSVLVELHKAKIQVVSIHQQISNDGQTPVVSLHFWGIGNTRSLAKGMRFAMNAARLYSKDQILVEAPGKQPPVPTYSAKVVNAVKEKLANTTLPAVKLPAKALPEVATASDSPKVLPAATQPTAQPVAQAVQPALAQPQKPQKNGLVNQVLDKMKFGQPDQVGLSQPSVPAAQAKTGNG